ncbi:MAG: glycosyltransferase [Crenarchaeota archaeon]|nr:glycosyltransferase [Thermoproteota archaeon]
MGFRRSVAIVHPLMFQLGGGEYMALVTARILKDRGFDVKMFTLSLPDRERIKRFTGFSVDDIPMEELEADLPASVTEVMHGRKSRYFKLLLSLELEDTVAELLDSFDVVFDTQGDVLVPSDITYVHYPWLAPDGDSVYSKLFRDVVEKRLSALRRAKILTNSSWTAAYVRKKYNLMPDVVYPPVDVDSVTECCREVEKEKFVLTISRFSPEKNLASILEVAKVVRSTRFVIVGNANTEQSKAVLSELAERIERFELDNVEIRTNVPRSELLELQCRAYIYLHPMYPEHFGISIVESMAAGAIPIVFKDGGAWYDIVSRVSLDLGYSNPMEAAAILKKILSDDKLASRLRSRAMSVASSFGVDAYASRIVPIVDYVGQIKKFEKNIN